MIEQHLRQRIEDGVEPIRLSEVRRPKKRSVQPAAIISAAAMLLLVVGALVMLGRPSEQRIDAGLAAQPTSTPARPATPTPLPNPTPVAVVDGLAVLPEPFRSRPVKSLDDLDLRTPNFGLGGVRPESGEPADVAAAYLQLQFPDYSFSIEEVERREEPGPFVLLRWTERDGATGTLALLFADGGWLPVSLGGDASLIDAHQRSIGFRGFATSAVEGRLTVRPAVLPDDWPQDTFGATADPNATIMSTELRASELVLFQVRNDDAHDLRYTVVDSEGRLVGAGVLRPFQRAWGSPGAGPLLAVSISDDPARFRAYLDSAGYDIVDWQLFDRFQTVDMIASFAGRWDGEPGFESLDEPTSAQLALVLPEPAAADRVRAALEEFGPTASNSTSPFDEDPVNESEPTPRAASDNDLRILVVDEAPAAASGCSWLGVRGLARARGSADDREFTDPVEAAHTALSGRARGYIATTEPVAFVQEGSIVAIGGSFPDRPYTFGFVVDVVELGLDRWKAVGWEALGC